MAFYKDADKKNKPKTNYANTGSWDDEGAHYKGAKKPASPSAGNRRFGPSAAKPDQQGKPAYGKPAFGKPASDRPAYGKPASDKPSFGRPASDKPAYGKPASDRPAYGKPASDRPAYGKPASDRPAYGKPAYGKRPGQDNRLEQGSRFEKSDRPARPARPQEAAPRRTFEKFEHKPPQKPSPAPIAPVAPMEDAPVVNENLLSGRNPIREALKAGRDIEKLMVAKGELSGSAKEIVMMAKEKHIPVQEVERIRLDEITRNHQGMLAFASAYQYGTVEQMLENAKAKGEDPFIILLDGITDPHNLGAIIRTAECVGAHGVIVPIRRCVGLTPVAVKASAGAVEHIPVAKVTNLTRTIEQLRDSGLWFYAADMEGESYEKADFKGGVGLVIGGEGEGISRLVLETCDKRVALPLKGRIGSLNASVAAGVLMYAVMQARTK